MIPPAHFWVPDRVGSHGPEAVEFSQRVGRELDEEQAQGVDAILSYGKGGKWLALESAFIEARQNGKTGGVLLPVVLWDLFLGPPDRIVWTAHLFRTAREAFMDFVALINGSDELSRRVKKISYANGEEGIYLTSGACLEFLARSKGGGRGLGGKRVVMDEALFLAAEAMGALMPTLSARPDPQLNYGSSAGVGASDYLRRLRDRGRKSDDPSLVYIEYCAPGSWENPGCAQGEKCPHTYGVEGCSLDNEALWPHANHALGKRITFEYVRGERRALPAEEFGRERLGWWDEPDEEGKVITPGLWVKLADPESGCHGRVAFAIEMSPERRVSINVGGRRADGKAHGEITGRDGVLDTNLTPEAAPKRLVELVDEWGPVAVMIDPSAPAGSLIPALEEAGLKVTSEPVAGTREVLVKMTATETAQACGMFFDLAHDDGLCHPDQTPLNNAIAGAKKRDRGDGAFTWSRKTSLVDISPAVGMSNAIYGFNVYGLEDDSYDPLDSIG